MAVSARILLMEPYNVFVRTFTVDLTVKYVIKDFFKFFLIHSNFNKKYLDANSCNSSPCLNNGACILNQVSGTYTCNCPNGFAGPNCALGIFVTYLIE